MLEGSAATVVRQIEQLVANARVLDGARLARRAGMHARAAELFESACEYRDAFEQALLAGEVRRAVLFAAASAENSCVEQAIEAVVSHVPLARASAEDLKVHGHHGVAARLFDRLGDKENAAQEYAEAGLAIEAADTLCALGRPREAAGVLETAHRANPQNHAVALRLAALLAAHSRFDAATRLLQAIPESSPLCMQALQIQVVCYESLGLKDSATQVRQRLVASGLASTPEASVPCAVPVEGCGEGENRVVYGRYEIVRTVGVSPNSQVFEALDHVTDARVAIKQLRLQNAQSHHGTGRDAWNRMMREARALALLRHTNVIPLVELIEQGGAVVTPWMDGGSLADLMERERITPSRAVEIAGAVLGALAEAHRIGILHRDVKPSNILFDQAGVPTLSDFGVAHVSDTSTTATAGLIGTLAYMSPEQQMGKPATPASDVFGVGAMLVEMLTGHSPSHWGPSCPLPSSFHPDLDATHDDAVLAMVAHDTHVRLGSAYDARKRLLGLVWPVANRGQWAPVARGDSPLGEERLQALATGVFLDRWAGRRVMLVADSESMRKVAKAWGAMDSRHANAALRYDAQHGMIWFEVPDGIRLSDEKRGLTLAEGRILKLVLEALHARGVAHGSVNAEHVVIRDGCPVLLFAREGMGGSAASDMRDWERLCLGSAPNPPGGSSLPVCERLEPAMGAKEG